MCLRRADSGGADRAQSRGNAPLLHPAIHHFVGNFGGLARRCRLRTHATAASLPAPQPIDTQLAPAAPAPGKKHAPPPSSRGGCPVRSGTWAAWRRRAWPAASQTAPGPCARRPTRVRRLHTVAQPCAVRQCAQRARARTVHPQRHQAADAACGARGAGVGVGADDAVVAREPACRRNQGVWAHDAQHCGRAPDAAPQLDVFAHFRSQRCDCVRHCHAVLKAQRLHTERSVSGAAGRTQHRALPTCRASPAMSSASTFGGSLPAASAAVACGRGQRAACAHLTSTGRPAFSADAATADTSDCEHKGARAHQQSTRRPRGAPGAPETWGCAPRNRSPSSAPPARRRARRWRCQ